MKAVEQDVSVISGTVYYAAQVLQNYSSLCRMKLLNVTIQ